jgi:hypothetical protein
MLDGEFVEVAMNQRAKRFLIALAGMVMLGGGYLMAQAAKPSADVNQLMRALFFPNSNVVFLTQRQDPDEIKRASEPSAATDPLMSVFNGWGAVENSALTISDSADLLMTPGRVCSNGKPAPIAEAEWVRFVNQLRDAGKVAYEAAKTKNQEKMLDASDVLNTSCANCHNRYRRAVRCQ